MAWMILKSLISGILVTLVSEAGKRNAALGGDGGVTPAIIRR